MEAHVECACCHRIERWRPGAGGAVERLVIVEGGSRRPAVDPAWARGRTALDCADHPHCRVVGTCDACGQLMVSEAPDLPAAPVVIDSVLGRLRIDGHAVEGPDGPLDPPAARALLAAAFDRPDPEAGWRQQVAKLPLFAVVFTVIGALLLGVAFVAAMVGAVAYGG